MLKYIIFGLNFTKNYFQHLLQDPFQWLSTSSISLSVSVSIFSLDLPLFDSSSQEAVDVTPIRLYTEKRDVGKNIDVFQVELSSL